MPESATPPSATPARIAEAFRTLHTGVLKGVARDRPVVHHSLVTDDALALFSTSSPSGIATQGGVASRRNTAVGQMAVRTSKDHPNSEDDRRRSSILARIEMLERSITDTLSLGRQSPVSFFVLLALSLSASLSSYSRVVVCTRAGDSTLTARVSPCASCGGVRQRDHFRIS